MRKHWLLFTQTVTIALALLFIVHTLKPELLPTAARSGGVVTLQENAPQAGDGQTRAMGLSAAAQKAMPAVVNIFTSTVINAPVQPFMDDPRFRFFFGDQGAYEPQNSFSLGSGVIVSPDGYILTNYHVVDADQIEVALSDGRKAKAHVIGSDPETDLAVIKIELPGKFPAITFGHSDRARVGDMVLAIGNPFGVGQTVTMGIISALKRDHLGLSIFESFIQTDAAINPGNSGGALVDDNGNLIGINSAIYSPNGGSLGIGFAIPVTTAKKTMEQIIQTGSVTRGWIGAGVQELTPELGETFKLGSAKGVLVTEVIRNSPAEKAGMRTGDILVAIDGKAISDWSTMLETVSNLPPGKTVVTKLLRDGVDMSLKVSIGKRPIPKAK